MSKGLNLITRNDVVYADSRNVADMTGKRHADLCRDIERYISTISTNAKLRSLNFFVESSYIDKKGESRKCYLLTKKGCDMVANKMTGERGILFTATYIDKFYEMETQLKGRRKIQQPTEAQAKHAEAMERNSRSREASLWLKIAKSTGESTYKEICNAYAANILAGKEVFALPEAGEKTYSATEVGKILGISANMVGKIANKYKLKIDKFGKWFHDKSQHSNKEVETFRYNEDGIAMLRSMAQMKVTENDDEVTYSTTVDLTEKGGKRFCAPLTISLPKKC